MAQHHHVSFPLQAPGELAGDVLEELEQQLGGHVALGSDSIVTVAVDADSPDEASKRVVDAIVAIHAGGYFDLHGLHEPMAISVRRYRLGAGSVDELARRIDAGFAHIVADAEGFVAYHLLDAGGGEVVSIKVFTTRDELTASDALTADWERGNLGDFRLSRLESTEGEVLVSRRSR